MILGIDVETTGLDPEKDEVIELGFALWDWEKKKPVVCWSFLLQPSKPLSEEVKAVTGIDDSDFEFQNAFPYAWQELQRAISKCDYIMAHNAQFDKAFIDNFFKGYNQFTHGKQWIDTLVDIDFDKHKSKYKNLTYLGATHEFINPFSHRALFDVLSMLKIASNYDLNAMVESAFSPMITVTALVSFDQKEEAKRFGFNWNATDKKWEMKIKKVQLDKIRNEFTFKVIEN